MKLFLFFIVLILLGCHPEKRIVSPQEQRVKKDQADVILPLHEAPLASLSYSALPLSYEAGEVILRIENKGEGSATQLSHTSLSEVTVAALPTELKRGKVIDWKLSFSEKSCLGDLDPTIILSYFNGKEKVSISIKLKTFCPYLKADLNLVAIPFVEMNQKEIILTLKNKSTEDVQIDSISIGEE